MTWATEAPPPPRMNRPRRQSRNHSQAGNLRFHAAECCRRIKAPPKLTDFCQTDLMLVFMMAVVQYCHATIRFELNANVNGPQTTESESAIGVDEAEVAARASRRRELEEVVEGSIEEVAVIYGKVLLTCR